MRNRLQDAPWWFSALISGVVFAGVMTLFQRFGAESSSWTRSAITGVLSGLFFGALMGPFLRRQHRAVRAAVGKVPDRLRSAARRVSWRGPVAEDPELRSAALRLVDHSLDELQRRRRFTVGTLTALFVLETVLAVTSSGWYWLAATFLGVLLATSLLLPERLRRRAELLRGPTADHPAG